ncbi:MULTISPECIES: class II aldolase/adducin family protein [Rhodococcus]|uniref:Class II aldolase/adducin family protein n=1 Tax=Rhodococcus oxybenzonivorans TaxID=1990687 RepID=A0AAE4V4A9_9NOCA|nr:MULTISPECIES: class II aldolase/adducin family protein [Rhodococcus]MDV7243095.1 class II aldolase/adducin family protein [Rhodococcus oxybenzonivorans]MDV7267706.1 class II aldolase/adducin family protein [Rhodococcus oxybenzonivorans]MDV7275499.1 class II aldolase/adducin family protein [Rhodococcus oxybenzonivorans]MDV7334646.1 class II aldolase/adducin family protein [Rhodococcus oxybenzonivorans]MDV7344800.1 class II aldolase/adducin family protein [Rhodococcus oxybenzonivorans]
MTTTENRVNSDVTTFVEAARRDADKAFVVFRSTGTVSANGTVNFVERVPGTEIAVALNDPGPWADDPHVSPVVATFDGDVLSGNGSAGFVTGYAAVFRQHPEITSVVHIHTPWLGGWAQTHRTLPIRYAASQRLTLSREIPPHIDRSQSAGDFILERLQDDPDLVAIFEANGGVNVIGRSGLLELAKFVVLLEEGAQFQAIAESLGGSVEFDPSNLAVQWGRSNLADEARRRGLL